MLNWLGEGAFLQNFRNLIIKICACCQTGDSYFSSCIIAVRTLWPTSALMQGNYLYIHGLPNFLPGSRIHGVNCVGVDHSLESASVLQFSPSKLLALDSDICL